MYSEVELLQQLKKKYSEHVVSALVGAGFTKNMYSKAVSWWELLYDLVVYAYEEELQETYKDYLHKATREIETYESRLSKMVDAIIKRDGYLKVVSKFIAKKGCREAIDIYIEQKNPYFFVNGGKVKVSGDSSVILDDSNLQTHKALLECDWQQVFTTNYDNALEITSDVCNLAYKPITNDYQLSRENLNKAIIKIHGNLVDFKKTLDDESLFEFDNDKTRRYIISEDDYNTYFDKHQAFSYLMRIALLSGVYCLLGFSGEDQNFLGWLDWVKDILDKEPLEEIKENKDKSRYQQIKVFLILIGDKEESLEKKLFYRNHHIGVIHLGKDEVMQELNVKDPDVTNPQLLQSLFSYLRQGTENILPLIEESTPYYKFWQKIYDKLEDKACPSIQVELDQINQYRQRHRFVTALSFHEYIMDKLVRKESLTEDQKELLVLLIKDLKWSLQQFTSDFFLQVKSLDSWTYIQKREDTFSGVCTPLDENSNFDIYENILRAFYHFDFNNAELLLKRWTPNGYWKSVKGSVNYLFDRKGSLSLLEEYSNEAKYPEEKYIADFLYNCVDSRFTASKPLTKYKGLDGLSEVLKYLITQVENRKEGVLSYGQQEETSSLKDSYMNPMHNSCRALHFLADTGLNPCYTIVNVLNVKNWYKIFSYTYKFYPWPCLYYSAQYNDRKVLKRIGQDYAYDDGLREILPLMLNTVMNALTKRKVPVFMRYGLYQITKEFFVSSPEALWFDSFIRYLTDNFVQAGDKYVDYQDSLKFVALAINTIKDKEHVSKCLTTILDYYKIKASDATILLSSYLHVENIDKLTDVQLSKINNITNGENCNESVYIITHLCESNLLDDEIKTKFLERLLSQKEFLKGMNMRSLLCLSILAKDRSEYRILLIEEIMSRDFWGRTKGRAIGGEEYFFRFTSLPKEYIFTIPQMTEISLKLESTFNEIINGRHIEQNFFNLFHQDTLEEMNRFIEKNKGHFEYSFVLKFKEEFNNTRGYSNIEDALYSDDSEKIEDALKELLPLIKSRTFANMEPFLNIALQRILIKHQTSNTSLLYFVARCLECYTGDILKNDLCCRNLLRLLIIYSNDDLRIYNFQVVEATRCFIKIANILKDNGYEADDNILWWLNEEHAKRFNYPQMFEEDELEGE